MGLALKIFGAIALVVALVLAGTLGLTAIRARAAAGDALTRALTGAREAARLFIDADRGKLASGASAAVQVPAFVAAVVNGDAASVLDEAEQFREILGADYTLIADRAGILRARTDRPGASGDTLGGPLIGRALEGRQTNGVVVQDDERLYLAVATPFKDPASGVVLGMLLAARRVTDTLATEVRTATGSDLVVFLLTAAGHPVVVGSTVPRTRALDSALAAVVGAGGMDAPTDLRVGSERLSGLGATLRNPGGRPLGGYLVLRSRAAELANFRQLQRTLLLAMLLGLGLALAAAALVARQVSGPVRALVALTRRVAEGDYEVTVEIQARDEIGELASAFRRMIEELKAKQLLVEYLRASTGESRTVPLAIAGDAATPTALRAVQGAVALAAGDFFAGRYEIQAVLGMGGMGVVYRAWDRELGEVVAIKSLLTEAMQADAAALERFKQEIRLARRITHRNVVRTYDLGESNGLYFITMEFVEGQSLKHLVQSRGPLPAAVVLTLGKQLCRALEVAHEQGVIHRDIKPQNIIVEPSGTLKVMDFGIARLATRTEGMTQAGMTIGTPEYMAPEQLLGQEVDFRTDLYAAGAVLFECLTGRPPFVADSVVTLVAKQLEERPPAPVDLNPDVPAALSDLVLRVLSKDREQRPASAAALHDLLDGVAV